MIEVYLQGNEEFEKNGDMTLTPTLCDVELSTEGIAELTLTHTIDDLGRWEYLENENIIAAYAIFGKAAFRIYDREKNEEEVTAYARPVFLDSSGTVLLDVRPTEKNGQEALDTILQGTKYKARSNIKKRTTAYYVRKNIMEAIAGKDENSFITRWGGERLYDNFTIIVNDRIGGDYGACAEFGYNAQGITESVNTEDVVTRIVPVAYNGVMLGGEKPWVDSPLINNYANIKTAVIKFEDVKLKEDCTGEEEGFSTLEQLREELVRRCKKEYENGLDKPKVNYEVDMLELSTVDAYKDYKILENVGIGDDVRTRNRRIKIDVMARCIRLVYDCLERVNKEVELGNFKENYFDKTTNAADIIQKVVREDGTIKAEDIYGTIDAVKTQMKAQRDISHQAEVRAVLFEDLVEGSKTYGAMSIGTMGFCIASERTADGKDWDWKTFGTGQGFYADYICVGELDGALIKADSIKANSISIEYKKEVETHLSEAIEESERKYKNTFDELTSSFGKTYATIEYADQTAASLAEEAEDNANAATDEKLKKYATTVNMNTTIQQTAEAIKTEASKTYATFSYADQTAASLAEEAEDNANAATDEKLKKYATTVNMNTTIQQTAEAIKTEASKTYATFSYADQTAASLAEEAEDNANAATDEKLKKYATTVNMNTAIQQAAEEVKILAIKETNSLRHDYVSNGKFENLTLDDWKLNDTTYITVKNIAGLGNVASIEKNSTPSVYIYQSWKLKAGTYKIRFKAAAATTAGRVRVSLAGISYYTPVGALKTNELTQFETEVTVTGETTRYLYVYSYVTGTTVYVTDIEVLGKYEDFAESELSVISDSITGKVSKGEFSSYLSQYYNSVIVAFNNSSKYVQITAGQIAIYDYGVQESKKRAVFDETGNNFYRDGYYVGRIGTNQWSANNAHKGLSFDLESTGKYMAWAQEESASDTSYKTILCYSRANSIYTEKGLHYGCDVYGHNWTFRNIDLRSTLADGYTTFTGEIPIITKIENLGGGSIQWYFSTITVRNGLITSAPRS